MTPRHPKSIIYQEREWKWNRKVYMYDENYKGFSHKNKICIIYGPV